MRVSTIVNGARFGEPNYGVGEIVYPEEETKFVDRVQDTLIESVITAILENFDLDFGSIIDGGDDGDGDGSGGGTKAPPEVGPFPFE